MASLRCRRCKKRKPKSAMKRRGEHRVDTLCKACHNRLSALYRKKNYRRILLQQRQAAKKRYHQFRDVIFDYYGRVCVWCGEDDEDVLALDHINNDGNSHRRNLLGPDWRNASSTWAVYRDVAYRGFPDGFQTLCSNCNVSKHKNGGVIPRHRRHKVG